MKTLNELRSLQENGEMLPTITVTHHTPEKIEVTETKTIKRLKK